MPEPALERWEFGRPQPAGPAGAGFPGAPHLILGGPLRLVVRRAIGEEGQFETLPGGIVLTLIPVPHPLPGHPAVAVRVEVSVNLRPVDPSEGEGREKDTL